MELESWIVSAVPVSMTGCALCMVFWSILFVVCRGISAALAGKHYRGLSPADRINWDNFAWSMSHGIIGFFVSGRWMSQCALH
jgi:hypothetical protein